MKNQVLAISAIALASLPSSLAYTYTCNLYYSYNYYNYDMCNGQYCQYDNQCHFNNCSGNYCADTFPVWAIFLITFFGVFCLLSFIRACCVASKRRQIQRQNAALAARNAQRRPSSGDHHHHVHNAPPADTNLIVTGATVTVQPQGYYPPPQPGYVYAQPADQ